MDQFDRDMLADPIDRATLAEERHREMAIAAARTAATHAESAHVCQNAACGESIPEARRIAVPGCRFCVECQSKREQVLKRRGHAIHA